MRVLRMWHVDQNFGLSLKPGFFDLGLADIAASLGIISLTAP
jgi:hypothetical protein